MWFNRFLAVLSPDRSPKSEDNPLGRGGWALRLRFVGLALGIVGSVALILNRVNKHYPVQEWLFWRYAAYWALMFLLTAACLSVGHRISTLLSPRRAPIGEHLVTSFALGMFTFFLGMFIGGVAGLWQPWFAVVWPLLLFAAGAAPTFRYGRRLVRHIRWLRSRPRPARSPWRLPILGFGLISLVALYFVTITPANISYDARWYHLAIAEHYVSIGGIARFDEGWIQGSNPQLGSILYSWGFMLPWTKLFDKALICAHLEYLLFVWTLAGVPALVRRLLHGRRASLAWVATFLFPGIFLYDSNLSVGADHVGAFWAAPIFLALLRAWSVPGPRKVLPLAVFIAGAMLSKYTVIILAVGPILAMVSRGTWVGIARLVRKAPGAAQAWLGLGVFAIAGVVLTAPHWLKNWIWYGDPAYPVLHKHFADRPWTADSAMFYGIGFEDRLLAPKGTFFEKAWETFKILWTFAFEPHNWPRFHGDVPVFGFLFTISTVLLLAFRRSARVWALVLMTWIGMITWVSIHPRDRYLQSILPWMVAVTAAVLILAWRSHWFHRVLLGTLVGVQMVWGSDVYFFRTHAMVQDSPIKAAVDFIATGHEKKYDKRLEPFGDMERIGNTLPPDAKVLVHEEHITLGLQRPRVNDWPGYQAGLVYGRLASPRALYDLLTSWGVTHILWKHQTSRVADSIGGDLLFLGFAIQDVAETKPFGSWRLARLTLSPPEGPFNDTVAYLTCGTGYAPGLYHRQSMTLPDGRSDPYPKPVRPAGKGAALQTLIREAEYVVWNPKCQPTVERGWLSGFQRIGVRGKATEMYVRRRPSSP